MIRKKKLFSRPRKAYEKGRIDEENKLVEKYGLKNKSEIWKTLAKVTYFRRRAKALANSPQEEQEVLFNKLKSIGLNINSTADILDLKVENLLERRLSTVLVKKGLATTPRGARQMITHKRILVDGKVLNSPGYFVKVTEEGTLKLKKKNKIKPVKKVEEVSEVQTGETENAE